MQCRDSGFASAQRSSNGWQAGAGTSRIGGFGGIRGASGGTGGGDGGDGGGGDGGDGDALTMEGAALLVHSALYDLDNLTDVWESLESLAEQANYIWFTQELDARAAAGRGRRDGKRDGKRGGSAGSRRARRKADERDGGTPVAPPLVAGAEPGEYSIEKGLLSLNLLLFEILCFSPLARGDATAELTALPHLVRRAGGPASVFTLCTLYAALARRLGVPLQLVRARRPRTSAHAPTRACTHARMHHTSTHTSTQPPCAHTSTHAGRPSQHRRKFLQRLPFFRSASHFFAAPPCSFAAPTCACVRASLHARETPRVERVKCATRRQVALELPPVLRGRGPDYLLRLPAHGEQAELYIDVLAGGRLRAPWDLSAFANQPLAPAVLRECVRELTPCDFCVRLLDELADACEAADSHAEAAFWRVQQDVLAGQISLAEERKRAEEPPQDLTFDE